MQIEAWYSHLNGEEFLLVHRAELLEEVREVVTEVDAEACKTKISQERTMPGRRLYSPRDMNNAFKAGFADRGWEERRNYFWTTSDDRLLRGIHSLPPEEQKTKIEEAGLTPLSSHFQTDFVKQRVAVEVQFGKYSFVAHDLFVKHLSFYDSDLIDVAIEILPMKTMEAQMSSGPSYYEKDLLNVLRHGRSVPAVPLVLIGVVP